MNSNKHSSPEKNRTRTLVTLIVGLLCAAGIIWIKSQSESGNAPLPPAGGGRANPAVAVPDTTIDSTYLPSSPDTVVRSEVPDTLIGHDRRPPYEAGYEDGYSAGCDDGAAQADRASYDETSNFARRADRADYVRGYREGYAKGYEDGRSGKQFGISTTP